MSCLEQYPDAPPAPTLVRRTFLQWLWALPLAVALLQVFGLTGRFSVPPRKTGTFGTLIDVGPLGELPLPMAGPLHVQRGRFWLVSGGEGLLALSHTCTHLECLFTWDQEGESFVCPCHGSRFDRSGRVLTGPADRDLARFPLRIVAADGTVTAETDSLGAPLALPGVTEAGAAGPRLLVDTGRTISAPRNDHVS